MKTILSAATAVAIIIGSSAAFADSGDGPQFAVPQPVRPPKKPVPSRQAIEARDVAIDGFALKPRVTARRLDMILGARPWRT